MMQRPPGVACPNRTPWRLVLASLAVVLVGAVAIGAGALSMQTAVTPTPSAPHIALADEGTVTPTPRVIAVPKATTPSLTPEPALATNPAPAVAPSPTPSVTQASLPLATATPTPWLMVAGAPTATPFPRPTVVPSPTPVPQPSPTPVPPSPTAAPTSVPLQFAFGAEDWVGGFYRGDGQAYGRPWVAVYGAASAYPRAILPFALDVAPSGTATVTIIGLDDEWTTRNEIALEVNGQVVFSGPSPFADWDGVGDGADASWTNVQFSIPADTLRAGENEIAVANLTPASNFNAPPYVLLAEVTLDLSTDGIVAVQPVAESNHAGKKEKSKTPPGQQKPKKAKGNQGNGHGLKKGHQKSKPHR